MSYLITALQALAVGLQVLVSTVSLAAEPPTSAPNEGNDTVPAKPAAPAACTAAGNGFLKAKIAGAVAAEIDWGDKGTTCIGEVRPKGGIRLSFKNQIGKGQPLLIVFGIPDAQEGKPAQSLPVNVTVVREGAAQFFSTQGDDKCTVDRLQQEPLSAGPRKQRSYRIVVRGFCTEPARAVQGDGAVLLSRFDFASELHFAEDAQSKPATAVQPH